MFKDLEKFIPGKLNLFWTDVLKSWCEYNYNNPNDRFSVLEQIIWFNSFIRIKDVLGGMGDFLP